MNSTQRRAFEKKKKELAPLIEEAEMDQQVKRNGIMRKLGKDPKPAPNRNGGSARNRNRLAVLDDLADRQFERRVVAAGLNPAEFNSTQELLEAEAEITTKNKMSLSATRKIARHTKIKAEISQAVAHRIARRKEIRGEVRRKIAAKLKFATRTQPTGNLLEVRAQWNGVVNSYKAQGLSGIQAARKANEKHPELRQQLVALANS